MSAQICNFRAAQICNTFLRRFVIWASVNLVFFFDENSKISNKLAKKKDLGFFLLGGKSESNFSNLSVYKS